MNIIAFTPDWGVPEIVILPFFVAWIWTIVDCLIDKNKSAMDKLVWIVALLILNILGAIVYWAVRWTTRRRVAGDASK